MSHALPQPAQPEHPSDRHGLDAAGNESSGLRAPLAQQRVDRIVLTFTALFVVTMIGMFVNSPGLMMVPIPLMVALLTVLATVRDSGRWPATKVMLALGSFHLISLIIWVVAWVAVDDTSITMAGMTTSIGVLVLIAWPFYTIASGLLYAFCAPHSDSVRDVLTTPAPDADAAGD